MSRPAFESLLERLGQGGADGGAEYEVVRRKLIAYLDRRGTVSPEAAADEALDRVARKIEAGERIQSVRAYVFGVARNVSMEAARRVSLERSARESLALLSAEGDSAAKEHRLLCLERCLAELAPESRALVERYHVVDEERAALARRFGLTPGAMRTRVHRLRNALAACLSRCMDDPRGAA